jgi:hypothetical protein
MKYIWHMASALSAIVAGIQLLAVSDRISHFTTIAWKTGIETSSVIDAGKTMLFIFFGASAAFLCLALISEEKLRNQKSNFLYVSKIAGLSLIAGMVIWGGMVASPYVIISNR